MSLIDKTTIKLTAGSGGDGIISWRREAHHANGGPWGGDGGNGGDIIILGDHNENDLQKLKYIKSINAQDGEKGGTKLCHGANGEDTIIRVPLGTIVYDQNTNEKICDIIESGQEYILCKGGKGGHGNAYFKSSFNKAPNLFERGEKGQSLNAIFEMKYIADVGIVGYPNAGKSTLINKISNSKAKTANYQFTTLNPILGVVKKNNNSLIFADIPGLIEGASEGIGLGHDFLKHIERCNFLIHLISANNDDNLDVIDAYDVINEELRKYNDQLINKKIFVAISKNEYDLESKKQKELEKHINKKVYSISSVNEEFDNLIDDIFKEYELYKIEKDKLLSENISSFKEIKLEKEADDLITYELVEDGIWLVNSEKIKYWANRIPHTTDENIIRFNQKVNIEEIQKELLNRGAKEGDTFILNEEIEYIID